VFFKFLIPIAVAMSGTTTVNAAKTEPQPGAGEVFVEPGLWNWSHQSVLIGIPVTESNTECMPPEMAKMSLNDFAKDLDEGCSVSEDARNGGTIDFTLTCSGKYQGQATGQLTKIDDKNLQMSANGQVSLTLFEQQISGPFQFNASATHQGSCS